MSIAINGGPAFPIVSEEENGCGVRFTTIEPGMTLRDYFAAQAAPAIYERTSIGLRESGRLVDNIYTIVALASYEFADAMLEARTKESI